MTQTLHLSDKFPVHSADDWAALVHTFLKGRPFETLIHETLEGIEKGPLRSASHRPDTIVPLTRISNTISNGASETRPWKIAVPIQDPDLTYANTQALEDLEGGASAIRIQLGKSSDPNMNATGLNLKSVSDVKRLFNKIHTDLIPVTFAPMRDISDILTVLKNVPSLRKARINLGLSDLSHLKNTKTIVKDLPENWKLLTVNGADIHDAGGTDGLELAYTAAKLTDFMRDLGPKNAENTVIIELAADQDGHKLIAKIRAARRICARIKESFGLTETDIEIHAVTSKRMMQSIDPWTNFLRMTSAAFGAVCGGADTIMVRPFTQALGLPTPFGHRTARNIQLLLMEESQVGQVHDPAFGSYYHEHLTNKIAEISWKKFQDIEALGGLKAYENSGARDKDLKACQSQRHEKASPILGVTLHPTDAGRPAKTRIFNPRALNS